MMSKEDAAKLRDLGLKAIEHLHDFVVMAQEKCSPEEYEVLKKGAGLSIGRIQLEVLDVIYARYPELSHLK